jgi:hypothetical protein
VEVGKRLAELEKNAMANVEWKKDTKSNKQNNEACKAHADWVLVGRPVDKMGISC